MEVLLVNRKQHKLLQSYLHKVNNLIKYMYETMLVMQPVMYIYTQEGMHVSQIQLTWKLGKDMVLILWLMVYFMYVIIHALMGKLNALNKCLM